MLGIGIPGNMHRYPIGTMRPPIWWASMTSATFKFLKGTNVWNKEYRIKTIKNKEELGL